MASVSLCNTAVKWGFLFQNNPKDLDLWDCSGREKKAHLIAKSIQDMFLVSIFEHSELLRYFAV